MSSAGAASESTAAAGPGRPSWLGAAAGGALSLLLASSLVVLFPIGLLVAPLGLVPAVRQVAARGRGLAVWGWPLAVLAVLMARGEPLLGLPAAAYLLAYLLVVVVPAASLGLWRTASWSEGRWVAVTTLAGAVLTLALVAAVAWPRPPLEALAAWWRQWVTMVEQASPSMGVSSGQLELALDAVEGVVPWVLAGIPVAYLAAVLFWIRPRLGMLGFERPVAPFEGFRNDEWLPAGFAAAGGGALLLAGTARWVAVTVLIAVLVLCFAQGLAIIRAHLARWIGRGWLVRWGVAVLCLQGPLPLVVAALGMADGFYPLRPRAGDDGGDR